MGQAAADLDGLRKALSAPDAEPVRQSCATAGAMASDLARGPADFDGISREALLRSAPDLHDGTACPVFDTEFDPEPFTDHLAGKLAHLEAVAKRRTALEDEIKPVPDALHAAGTALNTMIGHAGRFSPKADAKAMEDLRDVLRARDLQLHRLLPLDDTLSVLATASTIPRMETALATLDAAIAAIPEPTSQDAALDFLVVAQERLETQRTARHVHAAGKACAERAKKVFEVHGTVSTAAPEKIDKDVETTFTPATGGSTRRMRSRLRRSGCRRSGNWGSTSTFMAVAISRPAQATARATRMAWDSVSIAP